MFRIPEIRGSSLSYQLHLFVSAYYYPNSVSMDMYTLWRQHGAVGQKNIAHRMQSIFSFRRIGMRQGKKSGSHHFPLPGQPNCRGDVIFPAGRGWRPSIGFAMQNYDKFCNIPRQKCVILFHTIQLSHARESHAKTRRYLSQHLWV